MPDHGLITSVLVGSAESRKGSKRMRITKSHKWGTALLVLLVVAAWALNPRRMGGAFTGQPEDVPTLGPVARGLIDRAFEGLGDAPLVDYHAHLIGAGTGGTGTDVAPGLLDGWNPVRRYKAAVFLGACGVGDRTRLDQDYVDRLVRLARGVGRPLRLHLLAFDRYYNPDGTVDRNKVEFYVPNERVVQLAEQFPDIFIPAISVHPNRPDALDELEKWGQRGVRMVKWLPNVHGIDASDPRYDAYYGVMKKWGMVLLTHTGGEKSVRSSHQAFGNPLLFRRPLDLGLRVIMAHAASSGTGEDLDHPGTRASNFDLFVRMMEDEKYKGLLFADISATAQINRAPGPILELIRRTEWHGRLVNGSDYPLPAVRCVIWPSQLALLGLITNEERKGLDEIYSCNPLLYDFVLKRTLRDPKTGTRLAPSIFLENPGLRNN